MVWQEGPREQWEAISDLDAFFARVYAYYHEKGLRCILLSRILGMLMLGFTIVLTVTLVEGLNWNGLLNDCFDEVSCSKVHPFSLATTFMAHWSSEYSSTRAMS